MMRNYLMLGALLLLQSSCSLIPDSDPQRLDPAIIAQARNAYRDSALVGRWYEYNNGYKDGYYEFFPNGDLNININFPHHQDTLIYYTAHDTLNFFSTETRQGLSYISDYNISQEKYIIEGDTLFIYPSWKKVFKKKSRYTHRYVRRP